MHERFIAANDLLRDSFQLAANIYKAGFEPDFLVGLWRGGSSVGIAGLSNAQGLRLLWIQFG